MPPSKPISLKCNGNGCKFHGREHLITDLQNMNMDGAIALLHTVPITNDASSVMEHLLMRLMRPALSLPLAYFQNRPFRIIGVLQVTS